MNQIDIILTVLFTCAVYDLFKIQVAKIDNWLLKRKAIKLFDELVEYNQKLGLYDDASPNPLIKK